MKRRLDLIDATWPPARLIDRDGWRLREGRGGGSRVSAATWEGPGDFGDIDAAEAGMQALGQGPLFMIREGEAALDAALAARGYAVVDPVTLHAVATDRIAAVPPPITAWTIWPPLAVQEDLWTEAGIGPARLAIMHRAPDPKTALFGRIEDKPAATGFVAIADGIAMLHALEVAPARRRKGLASHMLRTAAHWAADNGAAELCLAVTRANTAANALYLSLGFEPVTGYHYRKRPEAS